MAEQQVGYTILLSATTHIGQKGHVLQHQDGTLYICGTDANGNWYYRCHYGDTELEQDVANGIFDANYWLNGVDTWDLMPNYLVSLIESV